MAGAISFGPITPAPRGFGRVFEHLNPHTDQELGRRALAGDLDARFGLVARYESLLEKLVARTRRRGPDADDLRLAGLVKLVELAGTWNPELCTFPGFVYKRLRAEISRASFGLDLPVELSERDRRAQLKSRRAA